MTIKGLVLIGLTVACIAVWIGVIALAVRLAS